MQDLLTGLANAVAGSALGWLTLGVVLHLANQVARGRGWWVIVGAAIGDDTRLRRRDAIAAWIAGAGAGGVVTARVGDALRVLLVSRRLPDVGASVLAGTIVAEAVGELAGGVVVLAVALAAGAGAPLGAPIWALVAVLPPAAVVAWLTRRRRRRAAAARALMLADGSAAVDPPGPAEDSRRARAKASLGRVFAGVRHGCAPLADPRAFLRRVAPWQLVSRLCRIAAMACFLLAFHLPATLVVVLLVFIAQGSGRLVPFSPAAVGAGVAVLAATFQPVTGTAVSYGRLAAFLIGTSTVLTAVGVVLAAIITIRGVGLRALPGRLRRVAVATARAR